MCLVYFPSEPAKTFTYALEIYHPAQLIRQDRINGAVPGTAADLYESVVHEMMCLRGCLFEML